LFLKRYGENFISFSKQDIHMKEFPVSLKRSRRSFVYNYAIGFILLFYIFFSGAFFAIEFALSFFFIEE